MKMSNKKSFTLIEVIIAMTIFLMAMAISITATVALNRDYKVLIVYLGSYLKGREAIDAISKDCRIAVRLMDSYAGYTTTTNSIVLKVPSIDNSGNIIDVNNAFDYIIYRLVTGDLWKTVIPGGASARSSYNGIFKKTIESLYVESDGIPLSSIPHKSAVTNMTIWISINEAVLGKEYSIGPGTTVKLMNYEWEYIR